MNDNKIVQLLGLAAAAWVVSLSQNKSASAYGLIIA